MKTRSRFSQLLLSGVTALLILPSLLFIAGAQPASAQMGANIYAAADLTAEGNSNGPEGAGSGATFESTQGGGTLVKVNLLGAMPGQRYLAQIRDGSCDGAVIATLSAMQTDQAGAGQATSNVSGAVEFGRWYVAVSPEGASGRLCGVVNPALAGPPLLGGTAPGMPATGDPAYLPGMLLAVLAVAVLALLLGYRLRATRRS